MNRKAALYTRCVESDAKSIDDMTDQARQISFETFRQHCDAEGIARHLGYFIGSERGPHLKDDRHVAYYKSVYQGMPCYYMDHSCIEHVFIKPEVLAARERQQLRAIDTRNPQARAASSSDSGPLMTYLHEPKYDIVLTGGKPAWQHRASREFITRDEPVFILRASDANAVPVLMRYLAILNDQTELSGMERKLHSLHRAEVKSGLAAFTEFRQDNFNLMKINSLPDCVLSNYHGRGVLTSRGAVVPADEPVFLIRGRDTFAAAAIEHYASVSPFPEQKTAGKHSLGLFQRFASKRANPMKLPDTAPSRCGLNTPAL